jgi:hypothetical protein
MLIPTRGQVHPSIVRFGSPACGGGNCGFIG